MRRAVAPIAVIGLSFIFGGCMSKFPAVSKMSSQATGEAALVVGLAPAKDGRPNNHAGSIGGIPIRAGSEAVEYVSKTMRNKLVERGFQVLDVPGPTKRPDAGEAPAARIITVIPILQSVSVNTWDELLFPATVDVDVAAQVYDETGKVAYGKKVHVEQRKRLWIFISGRQPGRQIARALEAAVSQILEDPEFLDALHAPPRAAAGEGL